MKNNCQLLKASRTLVLALAFFMMQQNIFGQCTPPSVSITNMSNISCASCCDGGLGSVVNGFPPYNLYWSTGAQTLNISNLCAGTYTVTVEYGPTCFSTASATLTESACGNHKTRVCHKNKTLCVDNHALPAHLAHGDFIGSCTSNREETTSDDDTDLEATVQVFPNPTSGDFTLSLAGELNTEVNVQVFNATGQVIFTSNEMVNSGDFQMKLDLSEYPNGLYHLKILADSRSYSLPVIKKQ